MKDGNPEDDPAYVTLRHYVEQRFEQHQRALDLATQAMEKRLDGMNEFRQSLRDQSVLFLTRAEYDGKHEALRARIAALERYDERTQGSVAAYRFLIVLLGVPGIAALAIALFNLATKT